MKKKLDNGKANIWIDRLILWKWLSYQEKFIDSMQCSPKFYDMLHRTRKYNPKIHKETKKSMIPKLILGSKNEAGDIILSDLKL